MKTFLALVFGVFTLPCWAQTKEVEEIIIEKGDKKVEEIVIRRKGSQENKIVIEFKNNEVLVNGKPLVEFKEDGITINKRNMSMAHLDILKDLDPAMIKSINVMPGGRGMSIVTKSGGFLGVRTEDAEGAAGAKVVSVSEASPAEKAGLKTNDIIVKVNNGTVKNAMDLTDLIGKEKPETEVALQVLRDGKAKEIKVKLGMKKQENVFRTFSFNGMDDMNPGMLRGRRMPKPMPGDVKIDGNFDINGDFDFEEFMDGMNPAMAFGMNRRPKIGLKIQDTEDNSGVQVLDTEVETAASKAGIQKDDVIVNIDGKKITNTDEAREALKALEGKTSYSVKAKRGGKEMTFEIKMPKKLKKASL